MFLDDPAITDGHLEAAENRHSRPEFLVKVKQDRALGRIHGHRNSTRAANRSRPHGASLPTKSGHYPQRLVRLWAVLYSTQDVRGDHGRPGAERAPDAGT